MEKDSIICKTCKLEIARYNAGKYPNQKDTKYVDIDGKIINGKNCADCHRHIIKYKTRNKRNKTNTEIPPIGVKEQKIKRTEEEKKTREKERQRQYQQENRKILREKQKIYVNNKLKTDVLFKLKHRLRTRLYLVLKQKKLSKTTKISEYLGCTLEELKLHIESQFTDGMNWDNYGEWHIDHIIPLSLAKTEEEVYKLNHYTNLQPLWANDNIKKSNKLTTKGVIR